MQPTGWMPFFIVYGREDVLAVELQHPTWRILDWEKVKTQEELLTIWAQQLRLHDEDMEEVRLRKCRKWTEAKEAFNCSKQL